MKRVSMVLAGAVFVAAPVFAATSLPSVTVSGVTATSPVLRSTAGIAVSATVTPAYDSGSTTTSSPANKNCKLSDNYCGTGNSAVTDQTVITTTTITISNQTVTASAADGFNSTALSAAGSAYSGTLTTPASNTDGKVTVTVTANVSEDVATTTTVETINKSCLKGPTSCTTVSDTTVTGTPSTVTKTASGIGQGSYVLDINPPTLVLDPDQGQPSVQQGGDKNMHNHMEEGSANSAYTVTDTITAPDLATTFSANGVGTFGPNGKAVDLVAVHVACNAPLGTYSQSATANTNDLGGYPFNPIVYSSTETFTVVPGAALQNQTYIVSDTPDGYNTMACFNATQSGRKIGSNPGSFHLAAVINTTGKCSGVDSFKGTIITMTLPGGFAFDTTGGSPAAHVFIVDAANGFDYHYPGPEISLPKTAITGSSTGTLTINLSGISINGGPAGVIPGTVTIYARAHINFVGTSVPADGMSYPFSTNVSATLSNVGDTSAGGNASLTKSSLCSNGN